jgi:glycosidase
MPEIFRTRPSTDILPSQAILGSPQGYHRRGRTVTYDEANNQPGEQTLNGDFPGGLKDVATDDPRVRDAMFEAYFRWIRLTDIDGFRIDTLKHVEHGFWQNFAPRIRQAAAAAGKRNFFLFGEAFDGNDRLIASYTNPNEMDSVVYFSQKFRVFDNIFQCGSGNTRDADTLLQTRLTGGYWNSTPQPLGVGQPPNRMLVNFMDNHDVSRFLYGMNPTIAPNIDRGRCDQPVVDIRNPTDVARFRPRLLAALTFLLTEDGVPCIYYGTEQDFTGGNDPSNRERLWDTGFDTTEVRAGQPTTFGWTRRLLALRRTYSALRRGTMAYRWSTEHTGAEPDAGMMAFERVDGANYALVVIHAKSGDGATTDGTTPMTVTAPAGTELVNLMPEGPRTLTVGAGGALTVALGPWQSAVYVPRAQVR